MLAGTDPSLGVLNTPMEVPELDGIEAGERDERKDVLIQMSQHLEGRFDHAEHKKASPRDMDSYLGKLEQEGNLSIEEPAEEVEGLILYQAVEERTMENSLDTEALMCNAAEEFVQVKVIPKKSRQGSLMERAGLADQVDEISEGQVDHVSPFDVPVVQPCDEKEDEGLKQLGAKAPEMELGSIYPEFGQLSCASVSVSSPTSNCTETTRESDGKEGAKNEASTAQCEGLEEDLGENKALDFSLDQDSKDNLLDQNEMKVASALPVNSIETKPPDFKLSNLADGNGEKKPEHLVLPVKMEDTKDVCPDSSEVKHTGFFSYSIKSEDLVTKAEQLDYPIKPEALEPKPEDLSFPMKPENLDTKPEFLQFVAYSGGNEVKTEVKPLALGFGAYPEGTKLKTETKPEGLRLAAFPETSAIKPEAKTEGLGFAGFPEGSEIKPEAKPEGLGFAEVKTETKHEMLEADSTVLTPKLEQVDGLADTSESPVVRGQVKEERPSTPGKSTEPWLVHPVLTFGFKPVDPLLQCLWWRGMPAAPGLQLLFPCVRFPTAFMRAGSPPSLSCCRKKPFTRSPSGPR